MRSEYRRLKLKMFLQIVAAAAATGLVGTALIRIFLGALPTNFAEGFIAFLMNVFKLSESDATRFYQYFFLFNRSQVLITGFAVLLILFLFFSLSSFIRYFQKISMGIDRLLDDSQQPIVMGKELKPLENKLNAVKAELAAREKAARDSEQQKDDLIVYLAHDLKTPLTSVVGYLNFLKESPDMPISQRLKNTQIALDKALRLDTLVNEFFEITKINPQSIQLDRTCIKISLMLEQLAEEFYLQLSAKNMEIRIQSEEGLEIIADTQLIARAVSNILKNAVAYGYEGSEIVLNARKEESAVSIGIQNRGPKIPEQQLEHVFEKFFRLDSARSSYSGGAGLGLAIAKRIVEAHGGTVSVHGDQEMTEFIVVLPLAS